MKTKARLAVLTLILVIIATSLALVGCNEQKKEGSAEYIQILDTRVYLAPDGEASTYDLDPVVFPTETASQEVYYSFKDGADREFLSVGTDGLLTASKIKEDEEGNPLPITITIVSAEDNKVTLDITVIIERVEVERIAFNPSLIDLEIHSLGVQLQPIFYPYHASIGRDLIYTSQDPSIATVSSEGFVTPVSIGHVAIWAKTPKTGAFDEQAENFITINVTYSELNYRMDLVSSPTTLKQIEGEPEDISFVLNQLDAYCDPSPEITWYVNTAAIDQIGVKDSKVLTYTPTGLPAGEYHIRAVIKNSTQIQTLQSDLLKIYRPLTSINSDIINENKSFVVGDIAQILVTYASDVYPPESYRWSIVHPDGTTEILNAPPRTNTSGLVKADLYYEFAEAGNYVITAEAVVKGRLSGVKSAPIAIDVLEASSAKATDVTGIYVDGTHSGENYLPVIHWDALPYNTEYEIEIRHEVDGETIYHTMSSITDNASFTKNTATIPATMVSLRDSFSLRIKSSGYGWTDWVDYNGTITASAEAYLDNFVGEYNAYVANIEEFGAMLNYIIVFRPESILAPGTTDIYRLPLYIPFAATDLDEEVYNLTESDYPSREEAYYVNAYRLFVAATRSYAESARIALRGVEGVVGGAVTILVSFDTPVEPSKEIELVPGEDDGYIYSEVNTLTNYSKLGLNTDRALAIDSLKDEMSVTTSNQLYLAVSMGYKPVPVEGSSAESIYAIAKNVLYSIIDAGMSAEQKALAIYEWLSLNVVYDYKLADLSGSGTLEDVYDYESFYLEGVFINNRAVCDGIAKAYRLMCMMEGIPCFKVAGVTVGSGIGHAWNIALINGDWYVVDATWGSEKATIEVDLAPQNIELLNRSYFGMGYGDSKLTRITFGVYPELATKSTLAQYTIKLGGEFDSYIESDAELIYFVGTYVLANSKAGEEVFAEIKIDSAYLQSKGSMDAIYTTLIDAAGGAQVNVYTSGSRICIRYER